MVTSKALTDIQRDDAAKSALDKAFAQGAIPGLPVTMASDEIKAAIVAVDVAMDTSVNIAPRKKLSDFILDQFDATSTVRLTAKQKWQFIAAWAEIQAEAS